MNAITSIQADQDESASSLSREHLSSSQQKAFDGLVEFSQAAPMVALSGAPGVGKSTILKAFANTHGGEIISWDSFINHALRRDIRATEESTLIAIEEAIDRSEIVLLDGIDALGHYTGRGVHMLYFLYQAILAKVEEVGRRVIFTGEEEAVGWLAMCPRITIDAFEARDYRTFLANMLGDEKISAIDVDLLYRHAPMLSGHDLRTLGGLLINADRPDTAEAVGHLEAVVLDANTRLEEVEALSFDDLPGTEAIAAKLETHVILPLENKELARTLGLKPKRGVLLYGPPGTGKTSIGRALAHRMKGRLHLIDGSFVTEPPAMFFHKVRAVVQEAKDNAPSVLFVDDADVLFGIEHISGLSRYLLSLLDGVESESAGQVCVMMTAMNVSRIPSAIMRSGRVELWLETRAPDLDTRAAIIRKWLGEDLPGHENIDYLDVAAQAENFTPADLRRITGDARTFHAADIMAKEPIASAQAYLARAIAELIATRAQMADNLRDESLRIGTAQSTAKYGTGIGGLADANTSCRVIGW